jgi:hypothetical protein
MIQFILLAIAISLPSLVLSFPENRNPTGASCVDPTGFLSCYDAQEQKTGQICVNSCATDGACIGACSTARLAGNVGCWIQSC